MEVERAIINKLVGSLEVAMRHFGGGCWLGGGWGYGHGGGDVRVEAAVVYGTGSVMN